MSTNPDSNFLFSTLLSCVPRRLTVAPIVLTCTGRTRANGETEQRLYGLDAWGESPYYSDRERAALAWCEAVTRIADTHSPDAVYEEVRQRFTEKEIADLTLAVASINAWNRLAIPFRAVPGKYQPAKVEVKRSA